MPRCLYITRKRAKTLNALSDKALSLFAAGRGLLASTLMRHSSASGGHRLRGESSGRHPFPASRPAPPLSVNGSRFAIPMSHCHQRLKHMKMSGTAMAAGFIRCGRRVHSRHRAWHGCGQWNNKRNTPSFLFLFFNSEVVVVITCYSCLFSKLIILWIIIFFSFCHFSMTVQLVQGSIWWGRSEEEEVCLACSAQATSHNGTRMQKKSLPACIIYIRLAS